MSDVRALLERAGEQIRPSDDAFERLVRTRDRRNRNRRIRAAGLALVVATGGTLAAFLAFRGSGSPSLGVTPASSEETTTYTDSRAGWSVDYPASWSLGRVDQQGRVSAQGVRISNFAIGGSAPSGPPLGGQVPDMSFLQSFPADGVLVQLWQTQGGLAVVPVQPDSAFPVSIDRLRPADPYVGGDEPRPRSGSFSANGESYDLAVWIGPEASSGDRDAAATIVRSWTFEPLTEGSVIGQETAFYVLGTPEDYPVGSVRRIDVASLPKSDTARRIPFYLVHVDEGFYALSWEKDQVGGFTDCDVRYDEQRHEFGCPSGARWDIEGKVLEKPGPGFPNDPLAVLLVRISLDGHVLVSTNIGMSDPSQDLKLT